MLNYFCSSYLDARRLFLEKCKASGAEVTTYRNPADAAGGTELCTDVAVMGPAHAGKALLLTAGTHGIEGLCGAAILSSLLGSEAFLHWQRSIKLVLVHAVNPWGMAHLCRCTENNVDLNRNFIDFNRPPPDNALYSKLHPILCKPHIEASPDYLASLFQHHFPAAPAAPLIEAIYRGQYTHADGVSFGGSAPEWSNGTIRRIVSSHVSGARAVAHIDFHTGLGPYGGPLLLAFHDKFSRAARRMSNWHGRDVTSFSSGFSTGEVPGFQGLMLSAIKATCGADDYYGMYLEFGTKSNLEMLQSFIIERWLRFEAVEDSDLSRTLRKQFIECYYPSDDRWRRAVLSNAHTIVTNTLDGLAAE